MKSLENKGIQTIAHAVMGIASAAALIPFILLIVSSLTDDIAITANGYSFFPAKWSLAAYTYLAGESTTLVRAYLITVLVTLTGTSVSMLITSMLAYTLSRRDFPLRNVLTGIVVFTLLFNGGLVPTYLLYTGVFHIKNTIWALIVPALLMNGFNVILVRTFFITSIPTALIESANIDGAGELRTYSSIILPLSLPIMATIGLLTGIMYWNDWNNGLIYLTEPSLFSIQNILNRILMDVQFLSTNSSLANRSSQSMASIPSNTVRMAIAVVGIIPIIAAYPFFQKYFVKGITIGAVKG